MSDETLEYRLSDLDAVTCRIKRTRRWPWAPFVNGVRGFLRLRIAYPLATWLRPYEESPRFNRALAGLRQLCWTYYCGHGLKFAFHIAMIYWRPRHHVRPR